MTSNINYLSINENFPIVGEDNDIQVFRDNFDTIKTSLRAANLEISDLQATTASKITDNNFNLNVIQNAVMQNNRDQVWDGGAPVDSPTTVDYQNGSYQVYRIGTDISFDFLNFPGDSELNETTPVGVGKVTLELYGDGTSRTITFSLPNGLIAKKDSSFPNTLTVQSSTNPVFIEVWRHRSDVIFMRYLGQFS